MPAQYWRYPNRFLLYETLRSLMLDHQSVAVLGVAMIVGGVLVIDLLGVDNDT